MTKLVEKVAGKLYIIGEYNVLKSGHGALIAPVTLFLEGKISESDESLISLGRKTLKLADLLVTSPYHYLDNTLATISLFLEYIKTQNIIAKPFHYEIINNLISKDNAKYGFGSSGASVVLTIKLLNSFFNTGLSALEIFKFATLVQKHLNKYSSGGDLALGSYNKAIYYERYDEKWLRAIPFSFELIKQDWPLLRIEELPSIPHFAVGWTKESFTPDLINGTNEAFFKEANDLVLKYKESYDPLYLTKYQQLLTNLSLVKPGLLTAKLRQLITCAEELGLHAKLSGAGYGDCGICQVNDKSQIVLLEKSWANHDIELLHVWRKEDE